MTFKIDGLDKLIARLNTAGPEAKAAVRAAVHKGGERIRSDAVKSISRGGRSGKVYKRGKGRYHQASAPGEFPKTDMGELVSNITVASDVGAQGYAITVGSRIQAPQGYWLETNAPSAGGRPWLAPVVARQGKFVFQDIAQAVKAAIEKR